MVKHQFWMVKLLVLMLQPRRILDGKKLNSYFWLLNHDVDDEPPNKNPFWMLKNHPFLDIYRRLRWRFPRPRGLQRLRSFSKGLAYAHSQAAVRQSASRWVAAQGFFRNPWDLSSGKVLIMSGMILYRYIYFDCIIWATLCKEVKAAKKVGLGGVPYIYIHIGIHDITWYIMTMLYDIFPMKLLIIDFPMGHINTIIWIIWDNIFQEI